MKKNTYLKEGLFKLISNRSWDLVSEVDEETVTFEELSKIFIEAEGDTAKKCIEEIEERVQSVIDQNFNSKSAWEFLEAHPYFTELIPTDSGTWFADSMFKNAYDFDIVEGVVCMEAGPYSVHQYEEGKVHVSTGHDYYLDSFGETFDETIVAMAERVLLHYGPITVFEGGEVTEELINYLIGKGVEIEYPVEKILENSYKLR